jgi:hypothetical protein
MIPHEEAPQRNVRRIGIRAPPTSDIPARRRIGIMSLDDRVLLGSMIKDIQRSRHSLEEEEPVESEVAMQNEMRTPTVPAGAWAENFPNREQKPNSAAAEIRGSSFNGISYRRGSL